MRTTLFLFLCILFQINGFSQTTQHQVFSSAGDQFTTAFMQQSWTLGEGVTEFFSNPSCGLSQGFQQSDLYRNLQGNVRYDNGVNTLLGLSLVLLKQGSTTLFQTIANPGGSFLLSNIPNGIYQLKTSPQKPWGGGNATDALMIMKHFTNVFQLQGLRRTAADVDASGYINSVDALQVMKRFVSLQNSFQLGDWVSESPAIEINGFSHQYRDLKALCTGDVDGSLIPGAKSEDLYTLTVNSIVEARVGDVLSLPLSFSAPTRAAAFSLVLHYNTDQIEVLSISMNTAGSFVYNLTDNSLRFAWYTTEPVDLQQDEALLMIQVRIKKDIPISEQDLTFILDAETLLSGIDGTTLENRTVQIPLIVTHHQGFYLGQNEPNPMGSSGHIPCYFPESGKIKLIICDLAGNQTGTAAEMPVNAGDIRIPFTHPGLAPGVYFYTLVYSCKSGEFRQCRRMVVIQ